ncbi:unnamed protein product [Parnassius apollo]|uniref:(apollo) hypothetical protein n=1 Tax=Parnassius apollo TaxID=110799 RepID=A0A8S3WNK4_PARAO|nr:unnamed protein product [Parnassius apollo]
MKWLFNFHEGAIAAYSNVFESLVEEGKISSEGMDVDHGDEGSHSDDYPHANNEIAYNADGLQDMYDAFNTKNKTKLRA